MILVLLKLKPHADDALKRVGIISERMGNNEAKGENVGCHKAPKHFLVKDG